ncbi:ubiquinone anaerobic biosynthesis accessory factor UbiT [Thalassospira mesophila]|uniref:ubiquinone anaerobic biosynthesis accessory factor UbiT n=1 Tax=Thalassospira mesophila TaxID=1293891 RepID=UPI000A1F9E0B|nr:SCP2 sterol-binding domain-containing protein [Thalassospira mesophila]
MPVARPAFTPFLLLGPLTASLPGWLIDRVLAHAIATMQARHRAVFDRFAPNSPAYDPQNGAVGIIISPLDLGIDLFLQLDPVKSVLRRATDRDRVSAQATILGPLPALLQLLEGTSDGDALFFSRTLKIKGRTDVVVALRNALDGETIDVRAAIGESFGMMGPIARRALALAERGYHRLDRDMTRFAHAFAGPTDKRQAGLVRQIDDLAQRLASAEGQIRRRQPSRAKGPSATLAKADAIINGGAIGGYANSTIDDFAAPAVDASTPKQDETI